MAKFNAGAVVRRSGGTAGGVVQGKLYKVKYAFGNEIKLEGLHGYYYDNHFVQVREELYEKKKVVEALEVLWEYNKSREFKDKVTINRNTGLVCWADCFNEFPEFKEKFLETEEDRKKKELRGP